MCLKPRTAVDCWHFAVLCGCQREMPEETADNVIDYISGFSTNVLISTIISTLLCVGGLICALVTFFLQSSRVNRTIRELRSSLDQSAESLTTRKIPDALLRKIALENDVNDELILSGEEALEENARDVQRSVVEFLRFPKMSTPGNQGAYEELNLSGRLPSYLKDAIGTNEKLQEQRNVPRQPNFQMDARATNPAQPKVPQQQNVMVDKDDPIYVTLHGLRDEEIFGEEEQGPEKLMPRQVDANNPRYHTLAGIGGSIFDDDLKGKGKQAHPEDPAYMTLAGLQEDEIWGK